MRRLPRKLLMLFFLFPLILAVSLYAAQGDACSAVVQQALKDIGQNCDALDRNNACYGFNKLGATFTQPQSDTYFTKASDRTPLNIVDTLTSSPLDTANNTWGVAVMKVQANVPNSLPGQAVTFVLLGDTQVRNDVSPTQAFTPADPVDVTSVGNVNMRSAPSTKANVVGSVTDGTDLKADGQSQDGQWLRVLFNEAPAWVSISLVKAPDSAGSLPVITDDLRTPMQAFYVTNGPGTSLCDQAPDVLMVQGPDTMKISLTINGANVQIGSTIVLRSLETSFGDLLNDEELVNEFGDGLTGQKQPDNLKCNVTQIMVIDGEANTNDGALKLPTGFTARSINCGGADRSTGFITPWGGSRSLTPDELNYLKTLNDLPPNILNYPIHVPTPAEIQAIVQAFSGGGTGGTGGATVGAAGNTKMCGTLKPTSPLGTMPGHDVPFYWDAADGATSYTVRVYDSSNSVVGQYSVNAPTTTVTGNPDGKNNLSWDVTAYVNGQVACTSARVNVVRDTVYDTAGSGGFTRTCINIFLGQMCNAPCTLGATCGMPGKQNWCNCPG